MNTKCYSYETFLNKILYIINIDENVKNTYKEGIINEENIISRYRFLV
ncbi:hypothetical protein NT01CX_0709 [Clostridium novyi NT]|uniref:Uncharacterized protein n=1 Tax=Clostridium novyi (strain NT) TaxID=386415 RepID=A0Q3H3_CLONN|nr:hypothetical protein NT01CX_0709 [Clostridium novyi NT]